MLAREQALVLFMEVETVFQGVIIAKRKKMEPYKCAE